MKSNRLYGDLAWLWPLMSPPGEYEAEAAYWREVLRLKLGPGRHALLDLGIGGGHFASHLAADFAITGVDLSEAMLANSRALNPEIEHVQGDMRTVRLGRVFDAVVVHDAIVYMTHEADLRAVFDTAAAHLRPGGVLITAVEQCREFFRDPNIDHATHTDGETLLTYVEYRYDPDPSDTAVEHRFIYFIRRGAGLRVEEDRHVTGLFPFATWVDGMAAAGFDVEQFPYITHQDGLEIPMLAGTLAGE